MRVLDKGGYAIGGPIEIPGAGSQDFIFARGWLLEVVELFEGEYYFISDGREVRPTGKRFGVFYPPFTVVRAFSRHLNGYNLGVGSEGLYAGLPDHPFIFETDHVEEFTAVEQAFDVLNDCRDRQPIAVNTRPSLLSLKTKKMIDENYLVYPSIARIAERLNISHEHLSRRFKKDYGMSPSAYLHQLRVADATFRLSIGEEIIEISQDVGYNDLSRFYKQFRKSTKTSPGACRGSLVRTDIKKRQDKRTRDGE